MLPTDSANPSDSSESLDSSDAPLAQVLPHIVPTPDGSHTAYNARFAETYGSRHGARGQALHVFLRGTQTHLHPAPHVLEVGFGVGVNFLATLEQVSGRGAALHYLAYEFDPAPAEVLRAVGQSHAGSAHPVWSELLQQWPDQQQGTHGPSLRVQRGKVVAEVYFCDVRTAKLPQNWATAIYLDGFSPAKNPEVWTPDLLRRLAQSLQVGGYLATYSAAGHVRRALAGAGLEVSKRVGATGKRECLQARRPA